MADMIQVTVNGGAVDPRRLEMHYQNDPYPGGARYTLTVADRELIDLIARRISIPIGALSRNETIWAFNMLRLHVSLHVGRGAPLFWANTIETIALDAGTLRISGVCSPHVDGNHHDDNSSAEQNAPSRAAAAP